MTTAGEAATGPVASGAVEALARSGRCTMDGGRCMVEVDGGPMGRMRIEAPAFLCGRAAGRPAPGGARVQSARSARFRSVGGGAWSVVGRDRRGIVRYRVSGYGDEDDARASLEFHPSGTALAFAVVFDVEPIPAR